MLISSRSAQLLPIYTHTHTYNPITFSKESTQSFVKRSRYTENGSVQSHFLLVLNKFVCSAFIVPSIQHKSFILRSDLNNNSSDSILVRRNQTVGYSKLHPIVECRVERTTLSTHIAPMLQYGLCKIENQLKIDDCDCKYRWEYCEKIERYACVCVSRYYMHICSVY